MLTVIVVSITKSDFHYHVVISKIVNITLFCSDVHYAVFTVLNSMHINAVPILGLCDNENSFITIMELIITIIAVIVMHKVHLGSYGSELCNARIS